MNALFTWPARAALYVQEALNLPSGVRRAKGLPFFEVDAKSSQKCPLFSTVIPAQLLIVVTTCDRAPELSRLLTQLRHQLAQAGKLEEAHLLVLEDSSSTDYSPLRAGLWAEFGKRVTWVRSERRMGKAGYFRTYQVAFVYAERSCAENVLFIQDDLELAKDAIARATGLFHDLKNEAPSRPLVLNLYASDDDEPNGRWVKVSRVVHPSLPVRRTQWFDLNGYLIGRDALRQLRFRLVPIHPWRWKQDPQLSSGVGRQLTRRLSRRADIYQCYPPLVFHGSAQSLMNPEAREQRSLDNYHLSAASGAEELDQPR